MSKKLEEFTTLMSSLFRPHTWHGVSAGAEAPEIVIAYIEIVPSDPVKLELNKESGHLSVDRPQRFSSLCPSLYGFVPQTYCGDSVGNYCAERTGLKRVKGDGDPLDICVLAEKDFAHGDLLVRARPIGGLRMIDHGEADDKIVAVLIDDITYGALKDISDCPKGVIERLRHYFLSYKQIPGDSESTVAIPDVYGRKEALEVIRRSSLDYVQKFGKPEDRMQQLLNLLSGTSTPREEKVTSKNGQSSTKNSHSKTQKSSPKRKKKK